MDELAVNLHALFREVNLADYFVILDSQSNVVLHLSNRRIRRLSFRRITEVRHNTGDALCVLRNLRGQFLLRIGYGGLDAVVRILQFYDVRSGPLGLFHGILDGLVHLCQ